MRLFIATSFPVAVMQELNARIAQVKPKLAAASWVRPDAQHVTFAFLGEQEEALIERLAPPLEARLGALARFEARLLGCGFFP
ncbi:MAG TPA: 2'-5' RNA ligase family protein, partial [Thermoanaerobaculia bacterium]|nr:2'-5' RNA ligase family protein [Thermoanaerobaculia bacterium]